MRTLLHIATVERLTYTTLHGLASGSMVGENPGIGVYTTWEGGQRWGKVETVRC
jgi:hypothetical protein